VHLLTMNTHLRDDPDDPDPGMLDNIHGIVQAAAPEMILVHITPPISEEVEPSQDCWNSHSK